MYKMKVVSILSLLISSLVACQKSNDVPLKDYSYYITGFTTDIYQTRDHVNGTGFFLRKSNRLFFITSKHLFAGCKSNNKIQVYPKNLTLKLSQEEQNKEINIDIERLYDSLPCMSFKQTPDIYVMEVNDTISGINVIEEFAQLSFNQVDSLTSFGFPTKNKYWKQAIPIPDQIIFGVYDNLIASNEQTKPMDSINWWFPLHENLDLSKYEGFSGAPAFIKNKNESKWKLFGVKVGIIQRGMGSYNLYYIALCPINYVLNEIDKLLLVPSKFKRRSKNI